MTCRYFDRFLLQGVDRNWCQAYFFYLAPGLICEGYWQVNSQRSIFHIADPTKANTKCIINNVVTRVFVPLLIYEESVYYAKMHFNWLGYSSYSYSYMFVIFVVCVVFINT